MSREQLQTWLRKERVHNCAQLFEPRRIQKDSAVPPPLGLSRLVLNSDKVCRGHLLGLLMSGLGLNSPPWKKDIRWGHCIRCVASKDRYWSSPAWHSVLGVNMHFQAYIHPLSDCTVRFPDDNTPRTLGVHSQVPVHHSRYTIGHSGVYLYLCSRKEPHPHP